MDQRQGDGAGVGQDDAQRDGHHDASSSSAGGRCAFYLMAIEQQGHGMDTSACDIWMLAPFRKQTLWRHCTQRLLVVHEHGQHKYAPACSAICHVGEVSFIN